MDYDKIVIQELLPQRPPFVMLDGMSHFDEDIIVTHLQVSPNNIFVENGLFTPAGIIENRAQTGAARMGYIDKYVNKGQVMIGFIGEMKNIEIGRLPAVGQQLTTTVEVVSQVFSTLLVKTEVMADGQLMASGQMKIVMTDKPGED
mgnify:FL=1